MKAPLILVLTIGISLAGFTQTVDRVKLDSLFDILSARNLAMGAISITQDGKPVYHRTVGKDQAPAATYRIGSITKVFTGVMIYELIDAKRLSFGDTLSEFFSDLPNSGKITIAEMLGHRSGIANFTATATNFNAWKEQPQTHEQLLNFIRSQQPDFAPGTKADYNNSNFLLLGYILEKIYRKPYKDIVNERIIQRLGLRNTCYGDHAGFQGSEVASYKYADNQWRPEKAVYLDNFAGAGAIISTPQDLCTFITAIFNGKFISMTSIARMTRIEKDGYGWGMFSFGDSLHTGYGHSGQTEGFASTMQYYPEKKLAIAYCTNGEVYPKDDIIDDVFKICFAEHCTIPTFTPITLTQQQLQPFIGIYTGDNGLQVTGTAVNGALVLETKGQQFSLDALSDHEFHNVRFGFFFEFDKDGKQLIVHDAATTYWLQKK
jgi:D-alanyl-D-alanine carboxypeptidase